MQENQFLLFLNHLRLPYSIPKSFALLLAFHIARHSFASVAKEKGVSSAEIKGILAHTNLSTTEKYMGEFDTAKTDKTLENVFGAEDNTTSTLMGILNTLTEEQKQQLIEQLQTNK